jgi:hypothetical protein
MVSLLLPVNLSGKLLTTLLTLLSAAFIAASTVLPGPVFVDTVIFFYQGEQWEARQKFELSPEVVSALASGNENVLDLSQQLARLKTAADDNSLQLVYNVTDRDDGWRIIEAGGPGQGVEQINKLFFEGQAEVSVDATLATPGITIFRTNIDAAQYTSVGGSNTLRIGGTRIYESNADQVQLGNVAIWDNPVEISVRVEEIPLNPQGLVTVTDLNAPGAGVAAPQGPTLVNVIRNGGFELPWPDPENGVAPEWQPFDNGRAHFSWYEEIWPEAVYEGQRAQLMEIYEFDLGVQNRVMAIFQTVEVVPNEDYNLQLWAILRTDAPKEDRNQHEIEMSWGFDPHGQGNYENVEEWNFMPLTEQARRGSFNEFFDDQLPLKYQEITGTIRTPADSKYITLFIRGLKKFATHLEVNMDIDEVSLVGPQPGAPPPVVTSTTVMTASDVITPAAEVPAAPPAEIVPASGGVLANQPASLAIILLGGLILVVLGTAATMKLLNE